MSLVSPKRAASQQPIGRRLDGMTVNIASLVGSERRAVLRSVYNIIGNILRMFMF